MLMQKYNLCSQFHVLRLNMYAKIVIKSLLCQRENNLSRERKTCENLVQKSEFLLAKKMLTVLFLAYLIRSGVLKSLLHHCHQLRNATVAVNITNVNTLKN